jgi:hypothetical protein
LSPGVAVQHNPAAAFLETAAEPFRKVPAEMGITAEVLIRADWVYQLRSACQSFHCRTLGSDRFDFERALTWLYDTAPTPATLQESEALRERLKMCGIEAALLFHREYHRGSSEPCPGSPVEATWDVWMTTHHLDPRVTLSAGPSCFCAASTRRIHRRPPSAPPRSSAAGS